jgi:hypothetical protein
MRASDGQSMEAYFCLVLQGRIAYFFINGKSMKKKMEISIIKKRVFVTLLF